MQQSFGAKFVVNHPGIFMLPTRKKGWKDNLFHFEFGRAAASCT